MYDDPMVGEIHQIIALAVLKYTLLDIEGRPSKKMMETAQFYHSIIKKYNTPEPMTQLRTLRFIEKQLTKQKIASE